MEMRDMIDDSGVVYGVVFSPQPKPGKTARQKREKTKRTEWKKMITRLDDLVREIIALRDAQCVLCGKTRNSARIDVGHLISRKNYTTRWDLTNCNAQCRGCNLLHEYHPEKYTLWFLKKYGMGAYESIEQKSHNRFERSQIEKIEHNLREALKQLQK